MTLWKRNPKAKSMTSLSPFSNKSGVEDGPSEAEQDEPLSYEEEVALHQASTAPHSSTSYPMLNRYSGVQSSSNSVSATGALSIESILSSQARGSTSRSSPARSTKSKIRRSLGKLGFIMPKEVDLETSNVSSGCTSGITSGITSPSMAATRVQSNSASHVKLQDVESPHAKTVSDDKTIEADKMSHSGELSPLSTEPESSHSKPQHKKPTLPSLNDQIFSAPSISSRETSVSPVHGSSFDLPHMSSPASSLIFERSVQDFYPNDEKIPTHYYEEDCIPPVLDASTTALTDSSLDVDQVDVISLRRNSFRTRSMTNSSALSGGHDSGDQSASPSRKASINALNTGGNDVGLGLSHGSSAATSPHSLPNLWVPVHNDRKVLSFYSYADIVNTEQQQQQLGNVFSSPAMPPPSSPTRAAFLTPTGAKSHSPVRDNGLVRNQRSLPNIGEKYPFQFRDTLVESPYEESELDGRATVRSLGDALRGKDLTPAVN